MGYFDNEFCEPTFFFGDAIDLGKRTPEKTLVNAASMYLTFQSLKEVYRPGAQQNWQYFDSSKEIAWKTGTSFGFRDAWAIGTTRDYVVGVWVGNADGEGRPGLVGVETAAPVLFDVFDKLPKSEWFTAPLNEMLTARVCTRSGYRATDICEHTTMTDIPVSGIHSEPCPYHKTVHLDLTEQFQVNTSCEETDAIVQKPWFVLPPVMEYYYHEKHPFYKRLPDFKKQCITTDSEAIAFIYPKDRHQIYLPKDLDGQKNDVILKVTHTNEDETLFWYVDNVYMGKTTKFHELAIQPRVGTYLITVMDEQGHEVQKTIAIRS